MGMWGSFSRIMRVRRNPESRTMKCKCCDRDIPVGDGYCGMHGGPARKDRELAEEAADVKRTIEARARARTPHGVLPPPWRRRFYKNWYNFRRAS